MESFATPYPVLFFDGEHEHDKGYVGIHSVLPFKKFQGHMGRLTGLPSKQLSTVFVCRRTLKGTEKRQKLPINENTNFNIILNQHNPSRERDCHFLVSIKKSKRERKGPRKRNAENESVDDDDDDSSRDDISPVGERPKLGSDLDSFDLMAPTSILQRPSSDLISNNIMHKIPCAKVMIEPAEKTRLLRRNMSQNALLNNLNSRLGSPNVAGQKVEGFNVLQDDHRWMLDKRWHMNGKQSGKVQPPMFRPNSHAQLFNHESCIDASHRALHLHTGSSVERIGNAGSYMHDNCGSISRSAISSLLMAGGFMPRTVVAPSIAAGPNDVEKLKQLHCYPLNAEGQLINHASILRSTDVKVCHDCVFCKERNGGASSFHCCMNDRVIVGFRGPSPAGPIERPTKRHIEVERPIKRHIEAVA